MKDQVLKSIVDDLNYALDKFDWGQSALDAKAIGILNTIKRRILELHLDPNMYNDN